MLLSKLIGGIVCAVALVSDCELFGLWQRGSTRSSKSVGGQGALWLCCQNNWWHSRHCCDALMYRGLDLSRQS